MDSNLLFKVKGYLCALADVMSLFKGSYIYSFDFIKLGNSLNAEEAVKEFLSNPDFLVNRHNIFNPRLEKCYSWEKGLLDTINRWFFNDIAFSESTIGYYESEDREKISLNSMLEFNYIAKGLLENIKNFFGESETSVFKLVMEEAERDEFAWEQYVFEVNSYVYILQFYRQG